MRNNKTTRPIFHLLSSLLITTIFLSLVSCTKAPEKHYLIGTINPNTKLIPALDNFKKEMIKHRYIEGKNVTYIDSAGGKDTSSALRDFQEKKVDLVLTMTTPPMKMALETLIESGIPIVGSSFDPVRGGVVKNLVYKKENITGIKTGGSVQKALEWLLLIVPDIKQVFVPIKFDTPAAMLSLSDLKEAALKLDVELLVSEVETLEDLQKSLSSIPEEIDAVFVLHSIFLVSNLDTVLATCTKRKLPSVAAGGLYRQGITISYGHNFSDTGIRLSRLAHKVLQGTPAFSLPFGTADFSLGINLQTAKSIDLDIPFYYLSQADTIDIKH